jgi:hypothetical protein
MDDDFFSPSGGAGADDFDFNRAAAAFPDLDDVPSGGGGGFTGSVFPDLDAPDAELAAFAAPPAEKVSEVRVTGGDAEIDAFEEQFPDLGDAPAVRALSLYGSHEDAC